jgi:hypothetical protein
LSSEVSFNTLMSAMIEQEGTNGALLAKEEEKRKRVVLGPSEDSTGGNPLKYRLVYTHQLVSHEFYRHSGIIAHLSCSRCYLRLV